MRDENHPYTQDMINDAELERVASFVSRGQVDMIANVIERQFKGANDWPFGAAMSLLLLYVTFIILAIHAFAAMRKKRGGVDG